MADAAVSSPPTKTAASDTFAHSPPAEQTPKIVYATSADVGGGSSQAGAPSAPSSAVKIVQVYANADGENSDGEEGDDGEGNGAAAGSTKIVQVYASAGESDDDSEDNVNAGGDSSGDSDAFDIDEIFDIDEGAIQSLGLGVAGPGGSDDGGSINAQAVAVVGGNVKKEMKPKSNIKRGGAHHQSVYNGFAADAVESCAEDGHNGEVAGGKGLQQIAVIEDNCNLDEDGLCFCGTRHCVECGGEKRNGACVDDECYAFGKRGGRTTTSEATEATEAAADEAERQETVGRGGGGGVGVTHSGGNHKTSFYGGFQISNDDDEIEL